MPVTREFTIDLNEAVPIRIPSNLDPLKPAPFEAKDGRTGWVLRIPGGRPIATPAYAGAGSPDDGQVFCPPALGESYMYLCSTVGHLLSVRQEDGSLGFLHATAQPMAFQPCLAGGNMYVGTSNGLLLCLRTGSEDADGWHMWGGNAQHNKND